MSFAQRMLEKRKEKGLSQNEMAKLIGTSSIMIGRYETGKMVPSIVVAAKIAATLGSSIDYLVHGFAPVYSPTGDKNIAIEVETLADDDLQHVIAVIEAFKTKAKVQQLLKD